MAFDALPELKVQLSVVDTPLGADPTYYVGVLGFGGWNDVTSDVRAVSIDRGRSNDLEKVGTGTASIKLSNSQRQYDPLNTASPYYDATSSTSFLRPRNQVRVFGVFPNDPTVDDYCYNLQNESVVTPTPVSGTNWGAFDIEGYHMPSPPPIGGVDVPLTSTLNYVGKTETTIIFRVSPREEIPWDDPVYTGQYIVELAGRYCLYIENGVLRCEKGSSPYTTFFTVPLPAHILSSTKAFWMKVVAADTFSNHKAYYCDDQFQVPTTWNEIAFTTKFSGVTYSASAGSVQISPNYAYVKTAPYMPVNLKRLQVWSAGVQYLDLLPDTHISLFKGYVAGWPQEYEEMGKDATVTLSCFDNSGLLGNMKVPTDLLETVIPPLSPWGWWKLGDASDTAADYSGNDRDLVYTPAGEFQHVTETSVSAGLSGVASVFLPSTSTPPYIVSGHKPPVAATDWSLSLWMLTNSAPVNDLISTRRIITFDDEVSQIYISISLAPSTVVNGQVVSAVRAVVDDAGGAATVLTSAARVTDGIPHHVVVTYDASTGDFYLYVDADESSKGASGTARTNINHGGQISMGRSSPSIFEVNVEPYVGALQDVTYWNNLALTKLQVVDIYNAGYGYIDETSGARIERVLDYAGFPARLRNIDINTYGTCGAVEYVDDQALLELMQKVEDTEVGILFTNRSGLLTLRGRYYLSMSDTGINVQANFDDANTNIGYRGLRFAYDADQLVNDHIIVDDIGAEFQAEDSTSVTTYGRRSRSISTLLNDTVSARNMAIGLTNLYKEPIMKAEPFEIVPLSNDWFKVLPLDIGDRVNLKATPMGVGAQMSQDLALQAISYDIVPKDWRVRIIGSPRPVISYFILGD